MEKICPNCQRPNASDAAFCRHCASPLPPGVGGGRPYAEQQQNWQQNQQQNQQWNQPPMGGGGPMQGGYAPPPGGGGGASGRAIGALIASICGIILCCLPAGIVGAILGWMEVTAIKEGRSSPAGMTMAQIGLWAGVAGAALSIIGSILYFLMLAMGGRY